MATIFEEKNISKAVLKAGVPAMLGTLTTIIYNLADTYFVALTKEPAMIAAVTLCMPVLIIIMSFSSVFGMGGSSVIARKLGEGNKNKASICLNLSTYAMVLSGLLVMVAGLIFITPIAQLIGADAENIDYTCDYLRWIFVGGPATVLSTGFVHVFRSLGMIKEATIGLALGNAVNIVFDWIFIILMGMGASGAALATSLGYVCSTVFFLICLYKAKKKGNDIINLSPRKLEFDKKIIADTIKIGVPGALITVLMSFSSIVLNNYIGIYGSDAVAAYGIAYKIDMFPVMLSVGLSQGIAPLVGYYFGEGNAKKMSETMKYSIIYWLIIGFALAVLIFVCNNFFAGIFLTDAKLLDQAALFLRLICIHAPLIGTINIITSYYQALGKAISSLVVTILRNIGLFIPGVVIMNMLFGLNGIMLNQFVIEVILTIICIVMYILTSPKKVIAKAKSL